MSSLTHRRPRCILSQATWPGVKDILTSNAGGQSAVIRSDLETEMLDLDSEEQTAIGTSSRSAPHPIHRYGSQAEPYPIKQNPIKQDPIEQKPMQLPLNNPCARALSKMLQQKRK